MQTTEVSERRPLANQSRGAQRRRRLKKAVECFNLDRRLSAERTRRAALITLTFAEPDYASAQGAVRQFWDRVRQRHLGAIYFCWLELHRSGRIHYHAIWVNPPSRSRRNLVASVDHWWGRGRTQVRFKQQNWRDDDMLAYALKYVNKMGAKRYQQAYDQLPSSLRTFMSSRLEVPPAELKHHLTREDWRYVPGHLEHQVDRPGHSVWVDPYLEKVGQIVHEVHQLASCSAPLRRRPGRRHGRSPAGSRGGP